MEKYNNYWLTLYGQYFLFDSAAGHAGVSKNVHSSKAMWSEIYSTFNHPRI